MRIENKVHVQGPRVHHYVVPLSYTGAQYSAVVTPRTWLWYANARFLHYLPKMIQQFSAQ